MKNGIYLTAKGDLVLIRRYLKSDGLLLIQTIDFKPRKYIKYECIKILIDSCEYLGEL